MSSTYPFPDPNIDDEFSWLQNAATAFDEKPAYPSVSSPVSHTSSGFSSSSPLSRQDSDSDSDSAHSSSDSDDEPLSLDLDQFRAINHQFRVLNSRKRVLPSNLIAPAACSSASVPAQNKRSRPSPSRNVQTSRDSTSLAIIKVNPWECPHCPWIQRNKRTPDLKRHIRTHTRLLHPAQWVCRGVLVEGDLCTYTHPADLSAYPSKPKTGGCGKTFSRRDALKRHLDNGNIGCAKGLSTFSQRV